MSVRPDPSSFPPTMLPRSWRQHGHPEADGRASTEMWRLGDGPFEAAAITEQLQLRPGELRENSVDHGLVEPSTEMSLTAYRQALADTREQWQRVLPEEGE